MAGTKKIIYEVFTNAAGDVVPRGDPSATGVEVVYVEDGEERRLYGTIDPTPAKTP